MAGVHDDDEKEAAGRSWVVKVEDAGALDIFERHPDLKDSVADYARASESKNTARARRFDWKVFTDWCAAHSVAPLPATPATAAAFLADQSRTEKKAVATVVRYARSIGAVHALRDHESPMKHEAVKRVLQGIRRERGTRQEQKAAFTAEFAAQVVPGYSPASELTELRDKAIVLFGLATAMRASSICSVDVEDLKIVDGGFVLALDRSKTDQEGEGAALAVHSLDDSPEFCPVRAIEAWVAAVDLRSGPLFCGFKRNGAPTFRRMTPGTINVIVKRVAGSTGLSTDGFGAHSLRSGYVTTAREQGVDWTSIMEQTGHKRLETVKLYTRYTPDVFTATKIVDVFRGAFTKGKKVK